MRTQPHCIVLWSLVVALAASGQGESLFAAEQASDSKAKAAALIRKLGDDSFNVREQAAKDLIALGTAALAPLREASRSPDLEVASRAAQCATQIERNHEIAARLAKLQNDPDSKARVQALIGLHKFRAEARTLVPALVTALEDPVPVVRWRAVEVLSLLGPPGRDAIPRMLEMLKDNKETDEVRCWVARALANMGNCEDQAAPILLKLLKEKSPELRRTAAVVLARLGNKHPDVVPTLLKALKDSDLRVQTGAAFSLGVLGKEPDLCVPALGEMLRSFKAKPKQARDATVVLQALVGFGEKGVPLIGELLADQKADVFLRRTAIKALEAMGPPAHAAVPVLTQIWKTKSGWYFEAAEALTKITGVEHDPYQQ